MAQTELLEHGWWSPSLDPVKAGNTLYEKVGSGLPNLLGEHSSWTVDGSLRYLDCSSGRTWSNNNAPATSTSVDWSLTFWAYNPSGVTSGVPWSILYNSSQWYGWYGGTTNACRSVYNSDFSAQYGTGTPTARVDDVWRLYGIVQTASTSVRAYVNNVYADSASLNAFSYSSSDMFICFGASRKAFFNDYWSGRIDDIRFFNRALTPSEIALIVAGGRAATSYDLGGSSRRRPYFSAI